MPVAEQQRPPGSHVIDVLVPIGVEYMRSFSPGDEQWTAAHAAKSPHRRVHAARNYRLRSPEQLLGPRHQLRLPPGKSLLNPKLIAISNRLPFKLRNSRSFN